MSKKPYSKVDPSFWLSLFFVAVIAVWVVSAARLDWDTRLFPWAVGIPALFLTLRQLVTDWKGGSLKTAAGGGPRYPGVLDIPVDRSVAPEEMTLHTMQAASWIFAFACAIWFVGFLISIPLFVFLYLNYEAQARKFTAVIIAGFTFLFVWGLFDYVMNLAWPEPALFRLLGYK
jgi:hypothetical protein